MRRSRYIAAFCCAAALAAWAVGSPRALAQVAVIGNPSVPVSSLGRGELLDAYTGDVRNWHDGQGIVVLDLKTKNSTKETFYGYLGMTSSRMKTIWMKRLLTGEGDPPDSFETEGEMIERVATTPGAVGYVRHGLAASNDRIKVLAVIEPEP